MCVVVASVIHTIISIKCSGLSPMYALQISPIFYIYYKACVCVLCDVLQRPLSTCCITLCPLWMWRPLSRPVGLVWSSPQKKLRTQWVSVYAYIYIYMAVLRLLLVPLCALDIVNHHCVLCLCVYICIYICLYLCVHVCQTMCVMCLHVSMCVCGCWSLLYSAILHSRADSLHSHVILH